MKTLQRIKIFFKRPKFKVKQKVRISTGNLFGAQILTILAMKKTEIGKFIYIVDENGNKYKEEDLFKY